MVISKDSRERNQFTSNFSSDKPKTFLSTNSDKAESTAMDESSTFVKPSNSNLENAVTQLLQSLSNDKDELVKSMAESSLIKIADKKPDEVIILICDYKKVNPKLSDQITSVILRVIEHITLSNIRLLENDTILKCIKYSISELTRHNEPTPLIQKPCKEILVSIGILHCKLVMDELSKLLQPHAAGHFMVLETLGQLARANLEDSVTYIKPILGTIIPMLSMIKHDFQKQSYANAIQQFCDAISEYQSNVERGSTASNLSNEPDLVETTSASETTSLNDVEIVDDESKTSGRERIAKNHLDVSAEIGITYDVFMQQWINTRDSKLCAEFLNVLSYMYPLLPVAKILDNTNKIIQTLLMMYKRSVDRASISVYLSSVIHTTQKLDPSLLDSQSDSIIVTLFDLICANPDFEKPVAVRSHNEVLRCYDLLAKNYGEKVMEIISTRFKSNDDREKTKALMLLTHLTNTKDYVVKLRLKEFLTILRQLVLSERQFKMKGIILRAVVAFAQKGFIQHKIFVKFLAHHCCHLVKIQPDQGTADEAVEFVRSCNNTLIILSRMKESTMDKLLKTELLQLFMMYEYTDACTTFAKCLATLFQKNPEMTDSVEENGIEAATDENSKFVLDEPPTVLLKLPSPESIFVRCLVLLAEFDHKERLLSILKFLRHFCPNLSGKHLQTLWNEKIDGLLELIKIGDDDKFYKDLNIFIMSTIKDIDDPKFSESLVNKMSDQIVLYQLPSHLAPMTINNQNQLNTELLVSPLRVERGMLMKIMGLCVCYVSDLPSIDTKIDLILNQVKNERLEKTVTYQELEEKFFDAGKALGYISRAHFDLLMKKFEAIINDDSIKKSNSFFNIQFARDTQKESDRYRLKILVIFGFYFIVQNTPKANILKSNDGSIDKVIDYLNQKMMEMRECQIKKIILSTLLSVTEIYLEQPTEEKAEFKYTHELLNLILKIRIENVMGSGVSANSGNYGFYDYLPLYPTILKLATNLIKLSPIDDGNLDGTNLLNITSHHFFTAAQNLNADDETQQSYLAPHINSSIPELNLFIKILLERNPSPAGLDDVVSILEKWMKEKNSQVRICASLIMEATLDSYIKTMKIGGEAPSKFHQTGSMLGKIIPRCIDSSGRVREICINILKKVLELACIYETLTIPDSSMPWMADLKRIRDQITVDDNEEIISMAKEIAGIIAVRLTNQQYVTFSKTLLYNLNDSDSNASAGAALVLNYFIQLKGSEMFHAIPDLVKDSFHALKCDNPSTRLNLYLSLVSLTKHHPKLVCAEMLFQPLPFDENVSEYWHSLMADSDLTGTIIDNFLETIFEMAPYEQGEEKAQKTLAHQPFAVVCALKEMVFSKDSSSINEFRKRFASFFGMLLTTLATYTNTIPQMVPPVQVEVEKIKVPSSANKNSKGTRFSFIPNRDVVKVNPALVVMDMFIKLMDNLGMEQVKNTLQMFPQLVSSSDLNNFSEFLPTLAVATGNSMTVNSSGMKELIQALSKYMSSPCDSQRIAAIGYYSQVVPLKPCGEISSVIMLHLTGALSDPNPLVRGFCIRGLAFVGALTQHDIEKYSELALAALLKGIDDYNTNCFINIPLESLRGLSRVIEPIKKEKLELFEVSLTIRIRPFFENQSMEIREAAILLFGDLCHQTKLKNNSTEISEALKEQLVTNLFPFLLHLGENESIISRACRITLRHMGDLLNTRKLNDRVQYELQEFHQLNYNAFVHDFARIACPEMSDKVPNFIESCLPYLRSHWNEIRSHACIIIGLLHHHGATFIDDEKYRNDLETQSAEKISACLKDEQNAVRLKAAESLGFLFSEP